MGEIAELQKKLTEVSEKLGKSAKALHDKHDEAEEKSKLSAGEHKAYQEKVSKDIDDLTAEMKKISDMLQAPSFQETFEKGAKTEVETKTAEALDVYYRKGKAELSADQKSLLKGFASKEDEQKSSTSMNEGNNIEGGYLLQPDFRNEIIKDIVEISPMQANVRTITTSGREVKAPKRDKTSEAFYVGERQTIPKTGIEWSRPTIPVNKIAAIMDVTDEELADSTFDLQSEFRMEFSEQFAKRGNRAILRGDGIDKPEGILTDSRMSTFKNGATFGLNASKLLQLQYQVKTGYLKNAKYYAQRQTISQMRILKDLDGKFQWDPGLNGGQTPNFAGFSLVEVPDMAQSWETSGGFIADTDPLKAFTLMFGDLSKLYWLVERSQMTISRNPFILEETDEIRFTAKMRHGGQVVRPEAAVLFEMSA